MVARWLARMLNGITIVYNVLKTLLKPAEYEYHAARTHRDATDEEIGRDRGNTAAKKRSPYRRRSTGWGGEGAQGGRAARGQGEQTALWRCLRAGPGP